MKRILYIGLNKFNGDVDSFIILNLLIVINVNGYVKILKKSLNGVF